MYILKYAHKDQETAEAEERLRSLSLGFRSEQQPELKEVTLFDDAKVIAQGLSAIQSHLDEVSGELPQWYFCNC